MDQDALSRIDSESLRSTRESRAGQVDRAPKLEQIQNAVIAFDASDNTLLVRRPLDPEPSRETIEHHIADIVRRSAVSFLRVAKPDHGVRAGPFQLVQPQAGLELARTSSRRLLAVVGRDAQQ